MNACIVVVLVCLSVENCMKYAGQLCAEVLCTVNKRPKLAVFRPPFVNFVGTSMTKGGQIPCRDVMG